MTIGYQAAFDQANAEGRIVVAQCGDCGNTFWHPRAHCPRCLSVRVELREPSWPAYIYTYTVNHRPRSSGADSEPTMIGYVELAGGTRMLVNLDVPLDERVIGSPVRPEVRPTAEGSRIYFVPATGE